MKREEVLEFFRRLAEANPSPTTELDYVNPYTLLVAVVLSAQATDASVNIATRPLFRNIRTPKQMVDLGEERVRKAIKTIGLFNTKAKNVIALSQALIDEFGGEVPRTREELQTLPGVGRKTANVVLNTAFGEETFAVDTHVFRVCNRTGLAPGKTPEEVEAKLERIVPQPFRRDAHHWLILHGRYICKARLPECWRCPVSDLCRYQPKTLPPEERVKSNAVRSASRGSSKARTAKGRTAATPRAGRNRSRPSRLP
ncbi:MAG TPA: endonuclease III [Sphingomicrobium sp.]|jgi:endonuclease-3|nr:endonuclease III [Sphingomicrobium sp.]